MGRTQLGRTDLIQILEPRRLMSLTPFGVEGVVPSREPPPQDPTIEVAAYDIAVAADGSHVVASSVGVGRSALENQFTRIEVVRTVGTKPLEHIDAMR